MNYKGFSGAPLFSTKDFIKVEHDRVFSNIGMKKLVRIVNQVQNWFHPISMPVLEIEWKSIV